MQIDYFGTLDNVMFDDYQIILGYGTSKRFLRIRYLVFGIGFFVIILSVINALFPSLGITSQPGIFIFLSSSCLIIGFILTILNMIQRKKNIGIKGEIIGQLSDEGNSIQVEKRKIRINWNGYIGYSLSENMILLVTNSGSQLIPKSFFGSMEDCDKALSLIKSKLDQIDQKKSMWGRWLFILLIMLGILAFVVVSSIRNYY